MLLGAIAMRLAGAGAQDLRIGFLAPRTGIFTQLGTDMVNGFQMYLDEHGGKLGGMEVKFIVEDDQGKPDVDVTKAKKLILQDKVDMLVGAVLATSAYALAPVSNEYKMLYIGTISTADDLAQRQVDKYPYPVLPTWVPSLPNHPLGQWACDQGYKRIVAIAADYAFGYEQMGGFQKTFEDCGGKVVQKIWVPFGNKDFGPYIPTMKTNVDAIFSLMVGPMALQFPKQLRASGNKKPIVGGGTNYDEFALPFMGDEVIGDVSAPSIQRRAGDAGERGVRQEVSRQIRQGAVVLFGRQLHHRHVDRPDVGEDQRQISRPDLNSSRRWRRSSSTRRAGRCNSISPPRARSRTSTSRRSRRRRCSATTRTSSGTR